MIMIRRVYFGIRVMNDYFVRILWMKQREFGYPKLEIPHDNDTMGIDVFMKALKILYAFFGQLNLNSNIVLNYGIIIH